MRALRPLRYGLSLCGAGGGGIAVLLLKTSGLDAVRAAVVAAGESHAAAVDSTGMVCQVLQQQAVGVA
jgi:galactokinase